MTAILSQSFSTCFTGVGGFAAWLARVFNKVLLVFIEGVF